MQPLAETLEKIPISMPRIKVYANTTGKPYTSVDEIRRELQKQVGLIGGYRWWSYLALACKKTNCGLPIDFMPSAVGGFPEGHGQRRPHASL